MTLKTSIETSLRRALDSLPEALVAHTARAVEIEVERTRDAQHGDFATNLAMRLARTSRQNPRKIAAALVAALPPGGTIERVEVAGAASSISSCSLRCSTRRSAARSIRVTPTAAPHWAAHARWSSSSSPPIRPDPCTSAMAGTRPTAQPSPTCSRPPATV